METSIKQKRFSMRGFIRQYMAMESASGVAMIAFAALAMLVANSPWSDLYKALIDLPLALGAGSLSISHPLKEWVKDLLMVFFFFIIGLELKHELREGFLSQKGQVLLPFVTAVGGMIAPALVYLAFTYTDPVARHGWAIPSATDIAFAVCVLTLVGKGIPGALKVFLLALAIFDDLGAVVIIALFYSSGLSLAWLAGGLLMLAGAVLMARFGVERLRWYMLLGVPLWVCFYHSGMHTTVAGVLLGACIPLRGKSGSSPLKEAIHALHSTVGFVILPLFAFVSAGISLKGLDPSHMLDAVPVGIALGLFLGKQIGIFGVAWLCIKSGLTKLPEGATWMQFYGVTVLAGIGFTMSLFVGLLAFAGQPLLQEETKIGVIVGSLLSTVWGALVLKLAKR